jgi:serine protease Do
MHPPHSWHIALAWAALALSATGPTARGQGEAEGLSTSFRKAARRVLPAVATVRSELAAPPLGAAPAILSAGGSGVVIDAAQGLVLTNDHVVPAVGRVIVTLADGRERVASQVRRDPRSDLALLTIDPKGLGLQQAEWGDSEALDTGDWVLAVGQPFGLSGTVTAGIISGKARGLGLAQYEDLVQTDAAINPGNSGGPLVNLKGEVVGINTAIKTLNGGYEGVGFAVPAARARRVASDLAEFGRVRRAYLGVQVGRVDPEAAARPGEAAGVPITGLTLGGPADRAGLKVGDRITKVGGKPVSGRGLLQSLVEFAPAGEPLTLTIVRDGQAREVEVRPAPQPEAVPPPGPLPPPAPRVLRPEGGPDAPASERFPGLGLRLGEVSPGRSRGIGPDTGPTGLVVLKVEPDGPADRAGVEAGMVVTDAAGRRVDSLAEFRDALEKRSAGGDLVLRVVKGAKAGFRVILDRGAARPAPGPGP